MQREVMLLRNYLDGGDGLLCSDEIGVVSLEFVWVVQDGKEYLCGFGGGQELFG
jgi:hypothetical protein